MRLAKQLGDINISPVVRAAEDNFNLIECLTAAESNYRIASVCGLRDPLEEDLAAFLDVINRDNLADFVKNPNLLSALSQHRGSPIGRELFSAE